MIEITVCGSSELQGTEADLVQGFVIDTEGLIGVFDKLVHGKSCVVRL